MDGESRRGDYIIDSHVFRYLFQGPTLGRFVAFTNFITATTTTTTTIIVPCSADILS